MSDRRDPQPGEVWERKGKRRVVESVGTEHSWSFSGNVLTRRLVNWRAVGPNHGQNLGSMELIGWHRRGWKLTEEAPHE